MSEPHTIMVGHQHPAFGGPAWVSRPHLMKLPKKVRRWLMTGLKNFWPIRCPECRQYTKQVLMGYTTTGGQVRQCVTCGRVFTRKESRDAK